MSYTSSDSLQSLANGPKSEQSVNYDSDDVILKDKTHSKCFDSFSVAAALAKKRARVWALSDNI
jgi:hypothetical protein